MKHTTPTVSLKRGLIK